MKIKLFVFILSLLTLLLSLFAFIEYKEVMKAQKVAGRLLSNEVNNMSIFVKGVEIYISQVTPKSMSEVHEINKEDLLKLSGSANSFAQISGNVQMNMIIGSYFSVLSEKLDMLAITLSNPAEANKYKKTKEEVIAIVKALDEAIDTMQKFGEDSQGLNYRNWYIMHTNPEHPIYESVVSIINRTELEWKFMTKQ